MKKRLIWFLFFATTPILASNPTLRNVSDDILTTVDQCCSQIDVDFAGTWTTLDEVSSKLDNISCSGGSSACDATAITSIPTTISTAGSYCLADTFNVASGNGITISVSNVILDLNRNALIGTGGANGVVISSNASKVIIKNGIICDMTENAILVEGNNCSIQSCDLIGNHTGINLTNANKNRIRHCIARDNLSAGFALLGSSTNCILDCKALGNGSNATSYGFTSSAGHTNLFQNCIADGTHSITTDTTNFAAGIALEDEHNTKIINCIVDGTSMLHTSSAQAYGILLAGQIASEPATLVTSFTTHNERTIDWSPDGTYLAGSPSSGSDTGILRIRKFENETFTTVTSYTPTPTSDGVSYPAWSPDGQYIAELGDYRGTPSYTIAVYHFDANGTETITQRAALDYPGSFVSHLPSWSPSGNFFAAFDGNNSEMIIFEFDATTDTITTRTAISVPNGAQAHWSSTGYLATAEVDTSGAPTIISTLKIYTFNESIYNLTLTTSVTETKTDALFSFVRWSPDGNYVLWHGASYADNIDNMLVYQFQAPSTLTKISEQFNDTPSSFAGAANYAFYSAWAPNSSYFVMAGYPVTDGSDDYLAALYHIFDSGVIQYLAEYTTTFSGVTWPAWSSQNYLAIAAPDFSEYGGLALFDTTFDVSTVFNCFIKNNIICYTHTENNNGTGILNGSFANNNIFTSNIAYQNDTNYQFIINVHTGLSGTPSILDNISLSN